MLSVISKRLYSSSTRRFAEVASNTPASSLVLNFVTPHASILNKKVISSVTIPGEAGEYGVTVGHSPIISQLQPGIVTVTHTGVSIKIKLILLLYFICNILFTVSILNTNRPFYLYFPKLTGRE